MKQTTDTIAPRPISQPAIRRVAAIKAAVAEAYGYRPEDLDSPYKPKLLSIARQVAMWVTRKTVTVPCHSGRAPIPLQEVAHLFHRRHHDSVIFAVNRIDTERQVDPQMRAFTDNLLAKFAKS